MLVGLHDADRTRFPNLALMKLSAWHKQRGDTPELWRSEGRYDLVYSSKVFTFTKNPDFWKLGRNVIYGGTGYGRYEDLAPEVDAMFPDYGLYPDVGYAIGYLTRGCVRSCPWCVVPRKEGQIRPYRAWTDIKRPDSRDIVLMDNNVLASDWGLAQMESMIGQKVRIDFNQGLDARLITPEVADMISRLKWIRFIRMACDTDAMLDVVMDRVKLLEKHGVKPYRIFCYALAQDVESAERRCLALRDRGVEVFAQPYRDFTTNAEPAQELKDLARWVNRKAIFKSCKTFADYRRNY